MVRNAPHGDGITRYWYLVEYVERGRKQAVGF